MGKSHKNFPVLKINTQLLSIRNEKFPWGMGWFLKSWHTWQKKSSFSVRHDWVANKKSTNFSFLNIPVNHFQRVKLYLTIVSIRGITWTWKKQYCLLVDFFLGSPRCWFRLQNWVNSSREDSERIFKIFARKILKHEVEWSDLWPLDVIMETIQNSRLGQKVILTQNLRTFLPY